MKCSGIAMGGWCYSKCYWSWSGWVCTCIAVPSVGLPGKSKVLLCNAPLIGMSKHKWDSAINIMNELRISV